MNKKFSTLVAVILAAGAWTTLSAAVTVTEANDVKAGTYLIGNDGNALADEEYDILLDPTNGQGSSAAVAVEEGTGTWTLVEGDGGAFKLQGADSKFFTASNPQDEGTGGLALTFEKTASENKVEVQFAIDGNKLKLANVASFANNTDIKGKDLYLKITKGGAATLDATGTELIFSNYADDTATPVVPGQGDLIVAENGDVTISSLPTDKTIDAPLYLAFGGEYLTLTSDGISALEAAPTATESLNSSWRWESGKLVSIAAERAGETAKYVKAAPVVKALADDFAFTLVGSADATTFTVSGNNLTFNDGTARTISNFTAKVSTTLVAVNETTTIANISGVIVGAANLPIFQSVPSDYVLVTLVADDGTVKYLKDDGTGTVTTAAASTIGDDYKQYLWKVSRSESGNYYNYSFTNLDSEKAWKLGGYSTFKAETDAVEGFNLSIDGTKIDVNAAATGANVARFAFYQSPVAAKTQAELHKLLAPGFDVTVKIAEKNNDAIKGVEVFGKTLYPIAATTATSVQLVDKVDKDGKVIDDETNYLVLDKKGWDGISASALNGEFIWVSAKDFKDTNKNKNWLSNFQVRYRSGKPSADVMETLAVMDGSTVFGNAFILSVDKINYLTTKTSITSKESWPYIKLASDNIVDVKTLLGKFWNIKFAETNVEGDEEYKLNGVLAVAYDADQNKDVADYVKANSVLTSSPETQWAVVSVESNGTFTMQNRENSTIKISGLTLRKTGDIYTIAAVNNTNTALISSVSALKGDQVYMTAVESHTKFDGFRTATVNELRNQVFNIGQYHNETGNSTAFWTENHQGNGTHQLGVVTEEADAVQWRLRLDMKPKAIAGSEELAEVDTVLVITKMAVWKDDKFKNEEKADTLAILPYQIQNKGNLEYVIFNDNKNQNYYACDENDDVEASALRFALKAKPNNTYNVVALAKRTEKDKPVTTIGDTKVYVANSPQWGSLKQIKTYSEDNNSLMQVIQIDKPEYRKIAAAWGDTVRIYREEYPTEVLFEKRDAKSVVDKDTLSFLNVNNSVTGANPALFVDTAYVNRVDKEGVANTCYQYLLAVNVDPENSYYCPYNPTHNTQEWRDEHNGGKPCADAMENRAVKGRFLINLVDTAFAYKADHLHNNPYVNNVEAYEHLAKLSFVEGIHANDTLYITRKGGEVVKLPMDTTAFNVAKFAFRYVDNEAGSFKIQTQFKDYTQTTQKDFEKSANDNGYLRWVNGTIVVTDSYLNGEVFNMEEGYKGNPVANEDITTSSISVIAKEGAVIINGAAGKKVTISNVLGQAVANTVISSDKAEISAPAGVVVVAVEGEAAVKAIVK